MGQENQEKKNPHIGGNVGDYFRKLAADDPFFAYGVALKTAQIDLAKAVHAERERQGLSLEQLARKANMPVKALEALEKGERPYRAYHTKLQKALGFDRCRARKK